MLLTLSPFAVDSLSPSYRHSQHPPRALIPHLFSQLKAKGFYMSRPIPVPASTSFMHPLLGRPLLLYPSPHANIISFFRPSRRPLSSRVRRTSSVICYYDRLIGSDSSFVALDVY